MQRKTPFLTLMIAGLMGLAAALFARNWMAQRVQQQESARAGLVPVVVAAAEIAPGERIRPEQLDTVLWPREHAPAGAFHEVHTVAGRVAMQKLLPGETVLEPRVAESPAGSTLAAMIEPSKRALTVRVNDVIGVAGFLLPGNRVDVLATRLSDERRALTRTLLENVKVLAVDQSAQVEKDQPVVVRAVTLELDPRQSELLVQATEEGSVQLALRNPLDLAPVPSAVVAVTPARPAPPPLVRRAQGPPPVEVIRQAHAAMETPRP